MAECQRLATEQTKENMTSITVKNPPESAKGEKPSRNLLDIHHGLPKEDDNQFSRQAQEPSIRKGKSHLQHCGACRFSFLGWYEYFPAIPSKVVRS